MVKYVSPEVHLVGRPSLDWGGMQNALRDHVGGIAWGMRRTGMVETDDGVGTDAENLVEFMGRLCYDSFGVGGNPNVTRVRGNAGEYFRNIIESGHGSVLEHAQFSFVFQNVSRVFTHELVRHRVGTAISQRSGRYVRPTELEIVRDPDFTEEDFRDFEEIERRYLARVDSYDWDSMPFSEKKKVTSTLRRKLPEGAATEIGWSGNIRALRNIMQVRIHPAAEWEINEVFQEVRSQMVRECLELFADI